MKNNVKEFNFVGLNKTPMFAELGLKLGKNENVAVHFELPTRYTEKITDRNLFVKYADSEGRTASDVLGLPDTEGKNLVGIDLRAWIGAFIKQHPEYEKSSLEEMVGLLLNTEQTCTVWTTENYGTDGNCYKNNNLREPRQSSPEEEVIIEQPVA